MTDHFLFERVGPLLGVGVDLSLRARRSGRGQRTWVAQPSFSKAQMRRAQVGSAWWELCQDSPIEAMASGQKFAALSRDSNGRSPIRWQIEFTDHVTWCSTATLTKLAQKNAVTAPHQDNVITPPSTAGA